MNWKNSMCSARKSPAPICITLERIRGRESDACRVFEYSFLTPSQNQQVSADSGMESKMSIQKPGTHHFLAPLFALALCISAPAIFAQSTSNSSSSSTQQTRSVTSGQKMKVKGTVIKRDADTFTVRDANGVDTVVTLTNSTSVRSKGKFLRSGENYAQTQILGGLNLEVEGRGDGSGHLIVDKIRFG